MVIVKSPIRCGLMVNEHIIKQVIKFNYLGTDKSCDKIRYEDTQRKQELRMW